MKRWFRILTLRLAAALARKLYVGKKVEFGVDPDFPAVIKGRIMAVQASVDNGLVCTIVLDDTTWRSIPVHHLRPTRVPDTFFYQVE